MLLFLSKMFVKIIGFTKVGIMWAEGFISISEFMLQVNVKSRCEQTSFPLNYACAARGHFSLISVIQQSCF